MKTPTVSVVMGVFNGERFLAEAVDSILNQSFGDFEFIVINDGSTDGSGAILDSYETKDPRMHVYQQQNKGLIESLNRGCSIARGKYIARMDADDIAMPDRLQKQIDFMEEHPEIGLLGGAIEYIDTNGRVFRTYRHPLDDQAIRCALYRAEGSFCHPATVMRSNVLVSAGGYRTSFLAAEDYDLWLRMANSSKLANLDSVVLKYRIHPRQISQQKLIQQGLSILGARECALSGGNAQLDTLSSECVITPEVLTRFGVNQVKQQEVLISRYRDSICTLTFAGDTSAALSLAKDMFRFSRWEHVERSLKAHLWLITASLYWRQGRPFRSLLAVSRALMMWPKAAGRPLKPLLATLSK
jgi:Glycosyl transferase family 2